MIVEEIKQYLTLKAPISYYKFLMILQQNQENIEAKYHSYISAIELFFSDNLVYTRIEDFEDDRQKLVKDLLNLNFEDYYDDYYNDCSKEGKKVEEIQIPSSTKYRFL